MLKEEGKMETIKTIAVLAKIIACFAVRPSSGREIMNRKGRSGGARIARAQVGSHQYAVSS